MARYGACFTGLDLSKKQILQARALTEAEGLSADYFVGDAHEPPFEGNMFDCITAVQCWQYMDSELAIPAFQRILKPGGHLAVIYMAWLPDENPVVQRSIETVRQFNPDWNGYDRRLQYFTPGVIHDHIGHSLQGLPQKNPGYAPCQVPRPGRHRGRGRRDPPRGLRHGCIRCRAGTYDRCADG